jgi:GxxExxY protein
MIRVPSPLDDETEGYVFETMECGLAVHKEIGPGFGEVIYENAFRVELAARKIPFECQKTVVVTYRGTPVGSHRLDLIVRGRVVVEVKAVRAPEKVHAAQVLAYLKSSRLPVGLLMNFGGATLREGIRRIILSSPRSHAPV